MSDDSWYGGESQEPGTGDDPYGRGRRASGARQSQSGQYSSEYSQQQYTQNPYPQGYTSQSGQGYYQDPDPLGGSQSWSGSQGGYAQSDYSQPEYTQSEYTQSEYSRSDYTSADYSQSGYSRSGYSQPQQQPQQPQQPQQDYTSSAAYGRPQPQAPGQGQAQGQGQGAEQYGRRRQPPRAASQQPQAPQGYTDPYASDPYASDPYALGSQSTGTYGRQQPPRTGGTAHGAQGDYGTARRDGYSTGSYATPGQQAPGQGQDQYRRRDTGSFERPGAAAGAAGAPGATGSRRRAASPSGEYGDADSSGEYGTGEFSTRPRRPSAPGYGEKDSYAGSRSESAGPGRAGRRAGGAGRGDEGDDDRFNLIDDEDDAEGDGRRGGKKLKQKKGRNCLAVFIAFSVLAGGLGYGGYSAYKWYQNKYGAPPDYTSSAGTGATIDVTVPSGSGGTTIGGLLFNAGVVKSQRAFTDACNSNTNCANIQAGTYLLPKGISAAAAVTYMLDNKHKDSNSVLITYGGERAAQVFAALEKKTGWKDSDIQNAIATGAIDLPTWDTAKPGAKFPYARIEGFIASESYTLTDFPNNPTALLKKMVDDQLAVFTQENLASKAQAAGQSEYNMLIIASLARAEAGTNTADLNKIAGVVFNRLKSTSFQHLGFDTATLYGMGNTTTTPNNLDTANPYNTSVHGIKGLPPGPIDNPDQPSIDAALNPTSSTFLFFCATPDGVQYATTGTQWQDLGHKYPGLCGNQ